MLSQAPTEVYRTILKEKKKKSGLVSELRQMFAEISGDFLVFFLQEKKGKKRSFFIGWARGVLQLPLLVLLLFFPLAE